MLMDETKLRWDSGGRVPAQDFAAVITASDTARNVSQLTSIASGSCRVIPPLFPPAVALSATFASWCARIPNFLHRNASTATRSLVVRFRL